MFDLGGLRVWLSFMTGLILAVGCSSTPEGNAAAPQARVEPAEAVRGEGLKNSFQVSPKVLRGGQPTREGMKSLEDQGVKTVINLRAEASDAPAVEGTSLKVVDVPLKSWKADHATIVSFLKAVTQTSAQGKCFFH